MAVDYIFGTPSSVSSGGLTMDIGMNRKLTGAFDGDKNRRISFMMHSGQNSSALEHSVPEQLYSTTDNPAEGISAVKALQLANEQGIPIYTITQSNIGTILPKLQVDDYVKTDVQNAVNAGKMVTVSKTNITFNGWTGCGYIVIDPNTGAGAYLLGGGINGAQIMWGHIMYGFAMGLLFVALLDIVTCLMGNKLMCAIAALMAATAMAFMNIALCLLASANYQPAGMMASLFSAVEAQVFYAAATGIMVAAFKQVPFLCSSATNLFKVLIVGSLNELFSNVSGIICNNQP